MVIKSVCYTPANGGYIYIRELGHGSQGTAILVRSVTDGRLYVLKKSWWEHEAGKPTPEVEFYRPHRRIPKLVYHEAFIDQHPIDRHPIDQDSIDQDSIDQDSVDQDSVNQDSIDQDSIDQDSIDQDSVHRPELKMINTLIMSYCSLVDLNQLQSKCSNNSGKVDEVLIWRCFSQMLEVIEFLHCKCVPKIYHGDIQSANVFAHFPTDRELPDFFLGDFGIARYIPEIFDKVAGSGYVVIDDYYITESYFQLKSVLSGLLSDSNRSRTNSGSEEEPKHPAQRERLARLYSEKLLLCYDALEWFIGDDYNVDDYQAELHELRTAVDTEAKAWEKRSTVDFSYLRPGDEFDSAFFFYDSQEELLNAVIQPPGPWQAAQVDTETWELLSIDPVVHHRARIWALDKGRTWD